MESPCYDGPRSWKVCGESSVSEQMIVYLVLGVDDLTLMGGGARRFVFAKKFSALDLWGKNIKSVSVGTKIAADDSLFSIRGRPFHFDGGGWHKDFGLKKNWVSVDLIEEKRSCQYLWVKKSEWIIVSLVLGADHFTLMGGGDNVWCIRVLPTHCTCRVFRIQ